MAHLNSPFLVVKGSSAHGENSLHSSLAIAVNLSGIRVRKVNTIVKTTILGRTVDYYYSINYYKYLTIHIKTYCNQRFQIWLPVYEAKEHLVSFKTTCFWGDIILKSTLVIVWNNWIKFFHVTKDAGFHFFSHLKILAIPMTGYQKL